MSNLIPFHFESSLVRVVMIAGNPWWVAADVCKVLEIQNATDMLKRLDDDERQLVDFTTLDSNYPATGNRMVNLINEYGLYSLVLGSRKAEAKPFKRWITHEVIPSIRKTGGYQSPSYTHTRALTVDEQAVNKLECTLKAGNLLSAPLHIVQQEAVKEVRKETGIDYTHLLVHAEAQQTIQPNEVMLEPTELAIELGFNSAIAVNKWLGEQSLQVKSNKRWEPTESGKTYCSVHAWNAKNKSGYNLRWNVVKLKSLSEDVCVDLS
jgi:prophage antirepressor-like protein